MEEEIEGNLRADLSACRERLSNLQMEKRLLERALDTLVDPISIFDLEGNYLWWNRSLNQVTGYTDLEIEELEPTDLFAGDGKERIREAIREVVATGDAKTEASLVTKDGRHIPFEFVGGLLRDEDGAPFAICASGRDITERREAKKSLRESEERFRKLSEAAFEGIVIHKEGEIIEANRVFADLLGYEISELRGMDGLELVATESRDRVAEFIASGYEEPYEAVMLRKEGTRLPVEMLGKALRYQGQDARVAAIRDITDRKRQEEIIRRQAEEILSLSTPVVQVWNGVVTAPLIGTLDSDRTQRFMEDLLSAIVEREAQVALVDITGVPTIDTVTAQHLIETISAVRLLGARVVLTGVRPSIAQTLVHLGIDLSDVTTRSSLAAGLEVALRLLDLQVVKREGKE